MKSRSRRYEVLLPVRFNDGKDIPEDLNFEQVAHWSKNMATFVVGVGWLFATSPLVRQAVRHNAARAVSKIILGIGASFLLALISMLRRAL